MRTVFKALSLVQADLAKLGIGKNQTNTFDKYKFRGIDDVLNALAPILAARGVLIVPSVKDREILTVNTKSGGTMNHAILSVDYTLYDSEGDSITHSAVGEAIDRSDKAINKAMTAAYKYFVFQAFCVPLIGHDADSETHEIADALPQKPLDQWIDELSETIAEIKQSLESGDMAHAAHCWFELTDEEKRAIWVAPSKGGPFTTAERDIMKSTQFKTAYHGEKVA